MRTITQFLATLLAAAISADAFSRGAADFRTLRSSALTLSASRREAIEAAFGRGGAALVAA
eukprot:CAMPEP_0183295408 /NCGR_PEP_ID=MMETSP0160_2-20130417/3380_1 /TAXON_ID=2839 ORGANISM="Odontella Sinensis, Strain Grunow 1884" /NCGR_SAMPLE_ID=MMETSP0160_2 /ASSEMBLY_ACC=CAM_ASM_000250 /LENGTH=60 /DNA_ID=CAMNT_0025456887 /DNA_START=36 /DNA_END=214 /DNA_ORIENTATION=+